MINYDEWLARGNDRYGSVKNARVIGYRGDEIMVDKRGVAYYASVRWKTAGLTHWEPVQQDRSFTTEQEAITAAQRIIDDEAG